ncbi:hypothetical protein [Alteromonas sp. Mac1]|uniref:hypothetical protein n=1 Tax=Alteromonas sp. Mac1 TaxID=1777491 RepID=UPI00076FFB20|nr:hypothetical protein [Alteromonas sp. Mac1]AMJ86440.1 hypothetical protein AV939_07490 [Alteromonas sp. Mac1]AMJ90299.1 hypothetical protein AV940_07320 [Alteromonas sp. Mac2]
MRKLILHIGLHKTGTSAIQKHLITIEDELKVQGWSFFRIRKDGDISNVGNINTWIDFTGKGNDFLATVDDGLYSALEKTSGNIIASCEELSWLTPEQVQNMESRLHEIFTDIKIICYVRRQDEHFISHYKQGFRYPHSSARMFYSFSNPLTPLWQDYYHKYLDYFAKAEAWSSAFGVSNIIFKEFNREKLYAQNSALDFMKTLGLDIEENIKSDKKNSVNEALSFQQCVVNDAVFETRSELWYELGGQSFSKKLGFKGIPGEKNDFLHYFKVNLRKEFLQSNIKLKSYIPSLSNDWVELSESAGHTHQKASLCTSELELYRESLVSLVSYIDDISLYQFLKFKLRKFRNKYISKIRKR